MGTNTASAGPVRAGRWEELVTARDGSYSPYSQYPVGAAALTEHGEVLVGANVENASFGLTLCAECAIVSQVGSRRHGLLVAVVCVDAQDAAITPCGRCRQLLVEHAAAGCEVLTAAGAVSLAALLPMAFGPQDLEVVRA